MVGERSARVRTGSAVGTLHAVCSACRTGRPCHPSGCCRTRPPRPRRASAAFRQVTREAGVRPRRRQTAVLVWGASARGLRESERDRRLRRDRSNRGLSRAGGSRDIATVRTAAGSYPPAFYLMVGSPGAVDSSATGVYLMRLVHAALCAALVASAVVTAARDGRNRLVLWGSPPLTPMALLLFGAVNPSGLEIAAAILLWTALGALLLSTERRHPGAAVARVGVGGSLLALSRPGSPLWVFLIVVALACLTDRHRLRALRAYRGAWLAAGVIARLPAASRLGRSLPQLERAPRGRSTVTIVHGQPADVVRVRPYLLTGHDRLWCGTGTPRQCPDVADRHLDVRRRRRHSSRYCIWRRERAVIVGIVAMTVLLPVVFDVQHSRTFQWAGRYTIPLAVGSPLSQRWSPTRTVCFRTRC